jgi:hypothetical protein
MLKLLPEQISRHWDILQYAIENTALEEGIGDDLALHYSEMLLSGQMQCWALYEQEKYPKGLVALLFTSIVTAVSGIKNLQVIGLYAFDYEAAAGLRVWKKGLLQLIKFGRANDCKNITFFTSSPAILKMTKEVGFLMEQTFGTLRIPDGNFPLGKQGA